MRDKAFKRLKRQRRVRTKVVGSPVRPRMAVKRTLANIFVQIIDDEQQKTILSVSTLDKSIKGSNIYGGNLKAAALLGEILTKKAKEKGISKVVLDRRSCSYHGRIKALAESARKTGLIF